jgi:hypothetical protein
LIFAIEAMLSSNYSAFAAIKHLLYILLMEIEACGVARSAARGGGMTSS